MAREWRTTCTACRNEIFYSDSSWASDRALGEARPHLCTECQRELRRELKSVSVPSLYLQQNGLDAPRALGKIERPQFEHAPIEHGSNLDEDKFGITNEKLVELFRMLDDPAMQVVVVVGPTGSGKSTFLPFRLLNPPPGFPDPEIFRRGGQIVVTQPRIQATRNIPAFVSRDLHGSSMGAGFDVGFRHSGSPMSDWRTRLVYVTDGTLINWIANGRLDEISVVMIDEAHERNRNIDLILGLLTRMLPRYPRLRLIIASATIDHGTFLEHFRSHLGGDERCGFIEFAGKSYHVTEHYRDPARALDYDPEDLRSLREALPREMAEEIVHLLKRMYVPGYQQPEAPGGDLTQKRGDILGFLQGPKPIEDAVNQVRALVAQVPELADIVDVLPLYTTLPQNEQDKALCKPEDPERRRVVISTNVAETSLTIHGILHVVDSGVINEATWDPETETRRVPMVIHSRAGCRQRWGRAGRLGPGDAWTLYTEEQFDTVFPSDSAPQIRRESVDGVALKAKAAGIGSLAPESFPWIDPPAELELSRVRRILRQRRCVDDDGDITPHGLELDRFVGDPAHANLFILADRFGCIVEMATLAPMLDSRGHQDLLLRTSDTASRREIREVHHSLLGGCVDDLDFGLKLYAAWAAAREGGDAITTHPAWDEVWASYLPGTSEALRAARGEEGANALLEQVRDARSTVEFEELRLKATHSAEQAWLDQAKGSFRRACSVLWGRMFFVNEEFFRKVVHPKRKEWLLQLSVGMKGHEPRRVNLEILDRLRMIFAWALLDRCYLRVDSEDEAFDGIDANYESLLEEGEEGEAARCQVRISETSVCHGRKLPAFACGQRRSRSLRPHPAAERVEVVDASFIVSVSADLLTELRDASETDLLRLVAQGTENRGPDERRETARANLMIEQRVPLSSRVTVRAPVAEPGQYDAEFVRLVDRTTRRIAARVDDPEQEADEDLSRELSLTIHIDGVDRIIPAVESDESDENADLELDDPEGASDEARRAELLERANRRHFPTMLRPHCELHAFASPSSGQTEIEAEVFGYRRALGDRGRPTVLLRWPPQADAFRAFARDRRPGDRITVRTLAHEHFPGDASASLSVVDVASGLAVQMDPGDLAHCRSGDRNSHVVKAVPIGAEFEAVIQEIDTAAQHVQLTTRPLAEPLRAVVDRAHNAKEFLPGKVLAVTQSAVHVLLDVSVPEEGRLVMAYITSRDHLVPEDSRGLGHDIQVLIQKYDRHWERLREISDEDRTLIEEHDFGLTWDPEGSLHFTGRMSDEQLDELLGVFSDRALTRTIRRLHAHSNAIRALPADPHLADRYTRGDHVFGTVTRAYRHGVFVRLNDGGMGRLPHHEMHPTNPAEVGDVVEARVVGCSVPLQRIDLSMRRVWTTAVFVPSKYHGRVYGSQGSRIRQLSEKHDVAIEGSNETQLFRVYGASKERVEAAARGVRNLVPWRTHANLYVPDDEILKYVIGPRGSIVQELEADHGVDIDCHVEIDEVDVYAKSERALTDAVEAITDNAYSADVLKAHLDHVEPVHRYEEPTPRYEGERDELPSAWEAPAAKTAAAKTAATGAATASATTGDDVFDWVSLVSIIAVVSAVAYFFVRWFG